MSNTQYAPDFGSREWWLDEFGADDRPYTADEWERLTPGAAFAKTLSETLPLLFDQARNAARREER
jgi:hypothetical protein